MKSKNLIVCACLVVAIVLVIMIANTSKTQPDDTFHIGIVTGTTSQGVDDYMGAELLIQRYGDVDHDGMIRHICFPDNFRDKVETVISGISALADDPKMKVIVVNQAIPGTAEAFKRIKAKRNDIICLAGEIHEDPAIISYFADLVVTSDFISRGYLIIDTAKKLGCDKFVHISFPRHMGTPVLRQRMNIMSRACKDLGIEFIAVQAPDPIGPVGLRGAQQFVYDHVGEWIDKFGTNTAFFCTNDAHTIPLINRVAELGGYFIEADLPSPLLGYPEAFNLDLSAEMKAEDWPAVFEKVEDAVVSAGGSGRLGTWMYSYGYTSSAALAEFGKRVVTGQAKLDSKEDLLACYNEYTPNAKWNGHSYGAPKKGAKEGNIYLVYQDTYIFGKGNMNTTQIAVPEKYR